MPDPARFPASCGHSDELTPDGVTEAPLPVVLEPGACFDQCGPSSVGLVVIASVTAPQPKVAVATHWPPIVKRKRDSLRESQQKPDNDSPLHGLVHRAWQAPAYATRGPSLSIRFVVHETDRSLGRSLNTGRNFGRHVRSLRRARGMTQEVLAERSGLSADTIRRLEHGSFSPSLETLRKLCVGLNLMLSTLFESFELGARNESRELIDLLATRTPRELILATRVLRALFDELDGIAAEKDEE